MSDPLQLIDEWPVGRVAAIARTPAGIFTRGPIDEAFALASVTKLLSAAAVLVAVEEGSVRLEDAVGPPGATLADLLAHASGVDPDDATVARAAPRTRRIYANAGFELAATHVEAATGMSFPTYLTEAVFEPVGMATSSLAGSAAHGARASARDLMNFVEACGSGGFLAPATLAQMTTAHLPDLDGVLPGYGRQSPNPWGLGPEIRGLKSPHWTGRSNSPSTWGHFGRSGTLAWVDPVAEAFLICLTDREFGDWAHLRWPELADAVLLADAALAVKVRADRPMEEGWAPFSRSGRAER